MQAESGQTFWLHLLERSREKDHTVRAPGALVQGWLSSPHGGLGLDGWPCLIFPGHKGTEEKV